PLHEAIPELSIGHGLATEHEKGHLDSSSKCPKSHRLRGPDLNRRPSGYEPDELPGFSTPRLGNGSVRMEPRVSTGFEAFAAKLSACGGVGAVWGLLRIVDCGW